MDGTALLQGAGALLPHLIILLTGLTILVLDLFLTSRSRYLNEVLGLVGIVAALVCVLQNTGAPRPVFMNMAVADSLGTFFNVIFLLVAALTVLMSASFVRRENLNAGEYYGLIFFATAGFMFVAAAADLVMVFLGIETLSIATYILSGLMRTEPRSHEAAFKYFILGAFSSALFLYGIATVYGALGTTNLLTLGQTLGSQNIPPLLYVGAALLIVGLGFKAAIVPFHMWAPDVYEGAPTSVTAFMTTGPKAAAFAALLRVFFQGFPVEALSQHWMPVFATLAALTMIFGNVIALAQNSIKRMLAYSSIAHAGYVFVALTAHNALGASSILYYLTAYSFMSLGSFTVLLTVAKQGDQRYAFQDYAGLATTRPWLAAAMSLFMFSLAGFPPTAGFAGKFYLFSAAAQAGYYSLALIGMLTSVVSVVYYARVVITMYMREPDGGQQPAPISPTGVAVLGITSLGVLYMGIFPGSILQLAEHSVQFLFSS
jgi:NADH-quinone oxidoreductase subunit N